MDLRTQSLKKQTCEHWLLWILLVFVQVNIDLSWVWRQSIQWAGVYLVSSPFINLVYLQFHNYRSTTAPSSNEVTFNWLRFHLSFSLTLVLCRAFSFKFCPAKASKGFKMSSARKSSQKKQISTIFVEKWLHDRGHVDFRSLAEQGLGKYWSFAAAR